MKIIIDISEEVKEDFTKRGLQKGVIAQAIDNGTPIAAGRQLIDKWKLLECLALVPMEDRTYLEANEIIADFPTIEDRE